MTPLPTSASGLPRAPGGAYVSLRKRGACSEPWPTPSTPPMASALHLRDVEHGDGDAACRAAPCAPPPRTRRAASPSTARLTRSRAQHTAPAMATPRSSAGVHAALRSRRRCTTLASFDGCRLRLVLEELVAAEQRGPRRPPGRPRLRSSSVAAVGSVVATVAPFVARRAIAAPARRRPSSVELGGIPDADDDRRLRPQLAGGRDGDRLARAGPRNPLRRGTRRGRRRGRRRPRRAGPVRIGAARRERAPPSRSARRPARRAARRHPVGGRAGD